MIKSFKKVVFIHLFYNYRRFFPMNQGFIEYVKKNYFRSSTFIYKDDSKENYLIICKNQTCSNKIKTLEELKTVVKNYAI